MLYTRTVDWNEFETVFARAVESMGSERFDLIVAIAQGGTVPAALLQQHWGVPLRIVTINYRDPDNRPLYDDARLLEAGPFPDTGKRILLVDDVSRTGRTLTRARKYLDGNTVKTFLVNGKADYSLYDTDECLRMPWKRD